MRAGKLVRATRSKTATAPASAADGEYRNEGRPGGGDQGDSAATAPDNVESRGGATAAATATAMATAATAVAPGFRVRRTQRKRSKTQLYAAGEAAAAAAAGRSKKLKKSARLVTVLNREREECAADPSRAGRGRDQDADGDVPGQKADSAAQLERAEAGVEKTVVVRLSLSGKNMTVWNRLRVEFGARDDQQVLERLLSSYSSAKPNSITTKPKQDPR